MNKLWFCLVFLAIIFFAGDVQGPDAIVIHDETKPIPRGFETYTLFLIPDEAWVSKERSADLGRLFGGFQQFGNAIGEQNLAVWFEGEETEAKIVRSRKYCDKFNLSYLGPFIVTSSKHPDDEMLPKDYHALDLNGISSERITEILKVLANGIVSDSFVWQDALNTSPDSFLRFRYPVKAATRGPMEDPKTKLHQIFSIMNNLPLEEKKLNIQILVILLGTLLASTFCTVKDRRIKVRQQRIDASAAVFFVGVVSYYILYQVVFFEYIGDTLVVLVLTTIYGLIPQRIVEKIPVVKRVITHNGN